MSTLSGRLASEAGSDPDYKQTVPSRRRMGASPDGLWTTLTSFPLFPRPRSDPRKSNSTTLIPVFGSGHTSLRNTCLASSTNRIRDRIPSRVFCFCCRWFLRLIDHRECIITTSSCRNRARLIFSFFSPSLPLFYSHNDTMLHCSTPSKPIESMARKLIKSRPWGQATLLRVCFILDIRSSTRSPTPCLPLSRVGCGGR